MCRSREVLGRYLQRELRRRPELRRRCLLRRRELLVLAVDVHVNLAPLRAGQPIKHMPPQAMAFRNSRMIEILCGVSLHPELLHHLP
jgi:hypothetical protein